MSNDDERDYSEEQYWREFCPACGTSPCADEEGHPIEYETLEEAAS